jgi:hypothetical protein
LKNSADGTTAKQLARFVVTAIGPCGKSPKIAVRKFHTEAAATPAKLSPMAVAIVANKPAK